ncbi:MAG: ABC transporter permease [Chloroflexota bacterium]
MSSSLISSREEADADGEPADLSPAVTRGDLEADKRQRALQRRSRLLGFGIPVLSLAAVVIAWDIAIRIFDIAPFILPPPVEVWDELIAQLQDEQYRHHTYATMKAVVIGFLVATVSGVLLGVAMATWRGAYRVLYPPIIASQGVPKTAVAPLFLLWFGFGMTSKVMIASLIAFFPVVVGTLHGLQSVSPDLLRLGRSVGLSGTRLFLKIRLPAALPEVFTGLKVGITLSIVGAIVAEFVAANEGLGYMLIISMAQMRTQVVMATLCILALAGVILYGIIEVLERVAIPWHVASGRKHIVVSS